MIKHSLTISKHRTSISLEKDFWIELKIAAKELNVSINFLVSKIDEERNINNIGLSSSIRVWILRRLKSKKKFD